MFFSQNLIQGLLKLQRDKILWWIVFQSFVLISQIIKFPLLREANLKSEIKSVVKIFIQTYNCIGGFMIMVVLMYCWKFLPKDQSNAAPTRTESSRNSHEILGIKAPPPTYEDAIKMHCVQPIKRTYVQI